jgi:hypothetical protein
MFENIEPNFFFEILCWPLEKAVPEKIGDKKWKKNEIGSKLFAKFEDLEKNSCFLRSFVNVRAKTLQNSF